MCDKGKGNESEGETFKDKKHFHKLMKGGEGATPSKGSWKEKKKWKEMAEEGLDRGEERKSEIVWINMIGNRERREIER